MSEKCKKVCHSWKLIGTKIIDKAEWCSFLRLKKGEPVCLKGYKINQEVTSERFIRKSGPDSILSNWYKRRK